jgi:hypothetical protein
VRSGHPADDAYADHQDHLWGLYEADTRHASTKVKRHLGLKRSQNGCGNWRYRKDMPYELAAQFARALEVDPMEVGL